jgi:hypothetical protein
MMTRPSAPTLANNEPSGEKLTKFGPIACSRGNGRGVIDCSPTRHRRT